MLGDASNGELECPDEQKQISQHCVRLGRRFLAQALNNVEMSLQMFVSQLGSAWSESLATGGAETNMLTEISN